MINGKKIVVVLPAYNAAATLQQTYNEIPHDVVDDIVLVDDNSKDNTIDIARLLGITHVIKHDVNKGYGGNQKTCYAKAIELNADIVVMLHPDYQYTPKLLQAMTSIIAYDVYPVVLGSRILGKGALKGGMPLYKYIANRLLTLTQNILCGQKLSEYHTGYRAFSREVFDKIDITVNDDNFVFDNEMLSQIIYADLEIAEITCPTKYFKEASSISFLSSCRYGTGVLKVSLQHFFARVGVYVHKRYK